MSAPTYQPFDLYDTDAAALRQLAYSDMDAIRARYAAMTLADQRAFAAANPTFTHTAASEVPAHLCFQITDARIAGDHALASSLIAEHLGAKTRREVAAIIAASRVPFAHRVILSLFYLAMGAVVTGALAAVGYVAFGAHGAAVAATLPAMVTGFVILRRLGSSRR